MTVDAEVDRMIAVVDLDSGETIHQIAFADEGEMPRNIYDIAVSPNGRFLAAISDDAARLWRIAD